MAFLLYKLTLEVLLEHAPYFTDKQNTDVLAEYTYYAIEANGDIRVYTRTYAEGNNLEIASGHNEES